MGMEDRGRRIEDGGGGAGWKSTPGMDKYTRLEEYNLECTGFSEPAFSSVAFGFWFIVLGSV
jgi:hypothetical protein